MQTPEYIDISEVVCHGCGLRYIFKQPIRFTIKRAEEESGTSSSENKIMDISYELSYEPLNLNGLFYGEFSINKAIKALHYVGECICSYWDIANNSDKWKDDVWSKATIALIDRVEPSSKRILGG